MHGSSTVHTHRWIGSRAVVKRTVSGVGFRGLGLSPRDHTRSLQCRVHTKLDYRI